MTAGGGAIIRRLTAADAEAFRDIRLAGLAGDPRAFSASFEEESQHDARWFAERMAGSTMFAADDGSRLLGITGLAVRSGIKTRHKALVWGVYVRPEARGQRLASRLLAAVIEAARGEVEALVLGVASDNASAIAAYRSAGFVATAFEARALYVDGAYVDEITMTLWLA